MNEKDIETRVKKGFETTQAKNKKISQLEKELAIANEALEDMAETIFKERCVRCHSNAGKYCFESCIIKDDLIKEIITRYKEKAKEKLK